MLKYKKTHSSLISYNKRVLCEIWPQFWLVFISILLMASVMDSEHNKIHAWLDSTLPCTPGDKDFCELCMLRLEKLLQWFNWREFPFGFQKELCSICSQQKACRSFRQLTKLFLLCTGSMWCIWCSLQNPYETNKYGYLCARDMYREPGWLAWLATISN